MIIGRAQKRDFAKRVLLLVVCVVLVPLCNAEEVPFLIITQPPEVREAWKELESLVRENSQLESPLPEPFLARAEIWTQAGSHEDAVADYVKAAQLMLSRDASLIEQSKVLRLLRQSLHSLSRMPRAIYPLQAADAYQKGYELYHRHLYEDAAFYLAESTRLNPVDSVYPAMRALNYRKLKRDVDASRQLAAAAGLLRRPYTGAHELMVFHRRMERIQGVDRLWITDGLVKAELAGMEASIEAARMLSVLKETP